MHSEITDQNDKQHIVSMHLERRALAATEARANRWITIVNWMPYVVLAGFFVGMRVFVPSAMSAELWTIIIFALAFAVRAEKMKLRINSLERKLDAVLERLPKRDGDA